KGCYINAELRQVNTAVITQRFNESMNRIKESIGGIMATIGTATATLGKPIKASIDFEDSFASVKKVLDDATDPQALKKGVLAMSVELGSATKDLNAILESAGQMGIKGDADLLKFTQTVQKMSVAFDMSADEAGKSMAQIQSVLNLSMDDMVMLGDTINHVSNNSTAKAADIIDMLKRLGGTGKDFFLVGKNFGFTAKQITGLGSAMIDLGMTPDVASTALSAVLNKLQAGGKPFKKWFDQMGLDFDEWSTQRAKNPEKALRTFFKSINELEDQDKTNALKDMFGLEHLGKIKTLTGSLEKYDKVMQLATSKESKGSMNKEFADKASTTAHQLKRLSAQMEVLYINLGDTMLPIINKFIGAFQAMLAPIANFAKEHKSATRAIMLTIGGVIGLKAA
ncbi:phage tail tape measure protein, partial [Helicobacter salomonis]|uniref:phage tail tape measure protein n=1 Tax=Helicobacter salomonis TaxID=56878 RepID=UPI000CF094F8